MRQPRPKIHLLNCSEPLLAYHLLEMRCGLILQNAVPKFMVAADLKKQLSLPIDICQDCLSTPVVAHEGSYFEYGLVEGEEEKHSPQYEDEEQWECVA